MQSAVYSPQTNAEVERFNLVMKEGLRTGMADGQSFVTAVRQTLAAYRSTPQSTTGVTPASLMFSFPVRTPLTILPQSVLPCACQSTSLLSGTSTSSSSTLASSSTSSVARRVQFVQQRMSKQYDRRHHARSTPIAAGCMVRIRYPNRAQVISLRHAFLHRC